MRFPGWGGGRSVWETGKVGLGSEIPRVGGGEGGRSVWETGKVGLGSEIPRVVRNGKKSLSLILFVPSGT